MEQESCTVYIMQSQNGTITSQRVEVTECNDHKPLARFLNEKMQIIK